jgi:hypothetical protein
MMVTLCNGDGEASRGNLTASSRGSVGDASRQVERAGVLDGVAAASRAASTISGAFVKSASRTAGGGNSAIIVACAASNPMRTSSEEQSGDGTTRHSHTQKEEGQVRGRGVENREEKKAPGCLFSYKQLRDLILCRVDDCVRTGIESVGRYNLSLVLVVRVDRPAETRPFLSFPYVCPEPVSVK